jgi:hypothetical protein
MQAPQECVPLVDYSSGARMLHLRLAGLPSKPQTYWCSFHSAPGRNDVPLYSLLSDTGELEFPNVEEGTYILAIHEEGTIRALIPLTIGGPAGRQPEIVIDVKRWLINPN